LKTKKKPSVKLETAKQRINKFKMDYEEEFSDIELEI